MTMLRGQRGKVSQSEKKCTEVFHSRRGIRRRSLRQHLGRLPGLAQQAEAGAGCQSSNAHTLLGVPCCGADESAVDAWSEDPRACDGAAGGGVSFTPPVVIERVCRLALSATR